MNNCFKKAVFVALSLLLILAGCQNSGAPSSEKTGGKNPLQLMPGEAGYKAVNFVGGVSFKTTHVPVKSFFTAVDDSTQSAVSAAYEIGETEVTYQLWQIVYLWATTDAGAGTRADGGPLYVFSNPGTMGDGAGDTNLHPVTTVNWRDAIVWCNALTEYYNYVHGLSLQVVYTSDAAFTTPIRNSADGAFGAKADTAAGSFDNPYVNSNAKGFRLPTKDEWELAARYIGDFNNDGDIKDAGEYYPGNFASGADANYTQVGGATDFDGDADVQYTDDVTINTANSGASTAPVKSRARNSLGLYDMSGNVFEWNFEMPFGATVRYVRGGNLNVAATFLQVGATSSLAPFKEMPGFGFRLARTL